MQMSSVPTSSGAELQCQFCPFISKYQSHLRDHIRIHTGEKPFKCPIEDCNSAFRLKSDLKSHNLRKHEKILKFECPTCSKKCFKKSDLNKHQRIHREERLFSCPQCPYQAKVKSTIQRHAQTVHAITKKFKCSHCNFATTTATTLRLHQRIHPFTLEAKQVKGHQCPRCPYKSYEASTMRTHLRTHDSIRPFKCSSCPYAASTRTNLKVHFRRRHTNERPFKCDFCVYSSATKSHLEMHMKTHLREKPFKYRETCTVCKASGTLKAHQMVQTKIEYYSCPLCEYMTTNSSNLRIHVAQNHTNKKKFKCPVKFCNFESVTKIEVDQHFNKHGEVQGENESRDPKCKDQLNGSNLTANPSIQFLKIKRPEKNCIQLMVERNERMKERIIWRDSIFLVDFHVEGG